MIPSRTPMKAPTRTLVRRLVGCVFTAMAVAVTRPCSTSFARDTARCVLKRLISSVACRPSASSISELRFVNATSFSVALRLLLAMISCCEARDVDRRSFTSTSCLSM